MPTLDAAGILDVMKKKRQHFRSLLDLSRRQRGLIDSSEFSQLLTVLGQKQRLLGRLEELNKQYPDLRSLWGAQKETGDPEWRDDCEHVLAETEVILAELLQEEQQSTDHLAKRRDDTRKELQTVSQGTAVNEAYRDSLAPSTHRHLNLGQ